MNIEMRAKEHIEDLQRYVKANMADVGGEVSDTLGTHLLSAIYLGSRRYHSISVLRKGRGSLLRRTSSQRMLPPSIQHAQLKLYALMLFLVT